jgi:hypothetical protein
MVQKKPRNILFYDLFLSYLSCQYPLSIYNFVIYICIEIKKMKAKRLPKRLIYIKKSW